MTTTTPTPTTDPAPPWEKNLDGTGTRWFEVRTDKGENERIKAVYLRDLVRWLMQSQGLHFGTAVRDMHKALAGLAGLRLYLLEPGRGTARLVGASDVFDTVIPSTGRRYLSRGIGLGGDAAGVTKALPYETTSGHAGALDFVLKVWGDERLPENSLDYLGWNATRLAMPCEQAALVWGTKPPKVLAAVTASPDLQTEHVWTGEKLYLQQAVFKADGKGKWTQRLEELTGLKERKIRNLIAGYTPPPITSKNTKVANMFPPAVDNTKKNGTKR